MVVSPVAQQSLTPIDGAGPLAKTITIKPDMKAGSEDLVLPRTVKHTLQPIAKRARQSSVILSWQVQRGQRGFRRNRSKLLRVTARDGLAVPWLAGRTPVRPINRHRNDQPRQRFQPDHLSRSITR
jgi:hypothetical protein